VFVSDSDALFIGGIDGIDPRVRSTFDLHVQDSPPTHHDDLGALDRQLKAISITSRAPHRFADILRWSSDSATKFYATTRTKNPDVFDRVQRTYFDDLPSR
jgi:hypothetical protein